MKNYIEANKNAWESAYEKGYGIKYPDTTLVTLYYRYMRPIILRNTKGRKANILDFGCGTGTNSQIFYNDNMNCFGIDISDNAIQKCKQNLNFSPQNFVALDLLQTNKTLEDIFGVKFDLIVCPQVLLHFNNTDLNNLANIFYRALVKGGLFFADMPTFNSEAYNHLLNKDCCDGLYHIGKIGSVEENLMIKVVNGKDEVETIFSKFIKVKCVKSIIECEHENEKINFLGQKA